MPIILKTDSYKLTHWKQYPENTEGVYSYFESRHGATFDFTLFFGLQPILQDSFVDKTVRMNDVLFAEEVITSHLGDASLFNKDAWIHIVLDHDGRLPLRIKAVPEGSIIPVSNVLMTVENTCDQCFWLTNYVETILTHVWYPSTVATLSKATKNQMEQFLGETGNPDAIHFMLHDFGYRGVSSDMSAGTGGAAHLINFKGTDTLAALREAFSYYDADLDTLAFSVPASEHSVMTSLGRDGEYQMLDRMLEQFPTGIVSVVADSYDIYKFTEQVCERANEIKARDGKFVLRPDSITSNHRSPQELCANLIDMLWDAFGGSTNAKGYKVLDPHVGMIWGDGIDHWGIVNVLRELKKNGYSAENMVFGMGGGLLQKVNRDTQRFAFKCSAQKRDGVWYDVAKAPLDSSKASKAGRLSLIHGSNGYETVPEGDEDILETVFEDGELVKFQTFDEIRERANA